MPIEEEKKEETEAPSSGNRSTIIKWAIVGVILLLFIGIEVGIAVFFVGKLQQPDLLDAQKQEEEKKAAEQLKAQTEIGATLAAPIEVTVNISGEDGRYIKCGVQLEYDPNHTQLGAELELRKARIKDIVLDIMSSKSMSELMTNDGKKAIRDQIVREVNEVLPQEVSGKPLGKIQRSYFDSFIIQ